MGLRTTPVRVDGSRAAEPDSGGLGFAEPARLRRVLMHAPGEEIDRIGPSSFHRYLFEDAVDADRFRAQHQALVDVLRGEGVEVFLATGVLKDSPLLTRIRDSPNLVYTRDTAAVTQAGAITMRMKSPVRRHEPAIVAAALAHLGVPEFLKVRSPATMEGGDVIFLDEQTALVGTGNRTNGRGLRQLLDKMDASFTTVVSIPLPRWAIHLDGTMMVIDRDLALAHRPSLQGPAVVYTAGKKPRRVRPLAFLKRKGMRFVEVTAYERQRRATNVITLGPRKLVGYAGHARVRRELAKEGVDLIEIEGSELVRGGGGPRCMTAPIERETREGPAPAETEGKSP